MICFTTQTISLCQACILRGMHFAMLCHGGHACFLPVLHAVACNLDWLVMAMHVYRWQQDQGCVPLCQPGWLAMPPRLPKRKVTR